MMVRETLDRILNDLKEETLTLESMVRQATLDSAEALVKRDYQTSRRVYQGDRLINEKRFKLEKDCIVAIATQQPMAVDLRALASILEICTELERMGDYAKGIARINFMLEGQPLLDPIKALPEMASIAANMLLRSVQAFVNGDLEEARTIPAMDDEVDELHNQISHGLVEAVSKNGELAETANTLQWAVHNIERMADRVINICERTVYMITGSMYEFESTGNEYGLDR
jgi:phosphate transport system protein